MNSDDRTRRTADAVNIESMINVRRGLIDRDIFSSEDVYSLEMERIFGRSWLFLCHESQFTKPGDFFHTYMGEDPVVVVKQRDGSLKAMLNTCRHRGMRVVRADEGSSKIFTCTYHGWAYDTAGNLVDVPSDEQAYYGDLDKSKLGLVSVAQLTIYKGLVFATWDHNAPPLEKYLGQYKWYLDAFLDRREGGTEVFGGVQRWRFEGNWKLAAEQFASDQHHGPASHVSAIIALTRNVDKSVPRLGQSDGRQFSSELGHGTGFPLDREGTLENTFLGRGYPQKVVDYLLETFDESVARLGTERAVGPAISGHGMLFPTFCYLPGWRTIRVWHPRGPHEMEAYAWVLVDKEAPQEVKEAQLRFAQFTFGTPGLLEQDDGENWAEIQTNLRSRGAMSRRVPFHYQMGLGHEWEGDNEYPGRLGWFFSEQAARGFYRHYLELMSDPVPPRIPIPDSDAVGAR